jgi:propionate CoA-transferase
VAPQDRFVENGPPRGLTLFYATRQGDDGERGLDHFAHDGPGAGAIGGHWAWRPGSGRWPVPGTSRPIACPRA